MRALLPLGAAMLGVVQGRKKPHFDVGHPWPRSKRDQSTCFAGVRAQDARRRTPRTRRADDGKVRRMARRMRASSPQAQGCAFGEPRRPLAHPEHRDVLRTCSRGGLSLGHLSLAMQRKVARPPGRRAKKDRDVAPDSTSISAASLECAFALQTALRAEPGIA